MQPEEIGNINNAWAFMAFAIATVGVPAVAWLSKHWVAKSQELEAEKTKNRTHERNKEIVLINQKIENLENGKTRLFQLIDEVKDKVDNEKIRNNSQDFHIDKHEKILAKINSDIEDVKQNTTDIKIEMREMAAVMNFIKDKLK